MFILLLLIDRASAGTVKLHVHVWSRSTFDVGRLGNRWIWETPIWTSPVISTPAAKGGEATAVVVQVGEGHSRIRRRRLLVPKHLKDGAALTANSGRSGAGRNFPHSGRAAFSSAPGS